MYFLLEVTFFPKILFKDSTINFYSSFPLYLKKIASFFALFALNEGIQSRFRLKYEYDLLDEVGEESFNKDYTSMSWWCLRQESMLGPATTYN